MLRATAVEALAPDVLDVQPVWEEDAMDGVEEGGGCGGARAGADHGAAGLRRGLQDALVEERLHRERREQGQETREHDEVRGWHWRHSDSVEGGNGSGTIVRIGSEAQLLHAEGEGVHLRKGEREETRTKPQKTQKIQFDKTYWFLNQYEDKIVCGIVFILV